MDAMKVADSSRFDEGGDDPADDRGPSCRECGSLMLDDDGARFCEDCAPEDEGDEPRLDD